MHRSPASSAAIERRAGTAPIARLALEPPARSAHDGSMGTILVVDDEPGLRAMLDIILRREGHAVMQAANGLEALEILGQRDDIGLVLCDLRMDPCDGLTLLGRIRASHPDIFVVIMTAFAEWDTAVRAMRQGAYHFLRKPFDNQVVKNLVKHALEAREHLLATRSLDGQVPAVHLIGVSASIQQIQATIEQVGCTESTILVTGESGTGKELVSRAIHYASLRADAPLVRINSGALAPSLLESELFGHVRGSFTGAIDDRPGLFALANGGTLFLDEVGELAVETQVKLLRVLECGEYLPVGGRSVQTANVRLVAATNRDLKAMVKAGTFREDLYYRLAVIPLHLPPLRERVEDIPLLAGHLLSRHAVRMRRGITGFTQAALAMMVRYRWPGNIRELDNRIQRGVAMTSEGDIDAEALFGDGDALASGSHAAVPAPVRSGHDELLARIGAGEGIDLAASLETFERRLIEGALTASGDNLTEAAKLLGISFRQIRYRVRQLGLR
jgi:DNA-binding NtrC family response regulator